MTIQVTKYENIKHKGKGGSLKLSTKKFLTFLPEEEGAELQWNIAKLEGTFLKTSRDADRHWIKLVLRDEEKPVIFEFTTREEVERLRRHLIKLRGAKKKTTQSLTATPTETRRPEAPLPSPQPADFTPPPATNPSFTPPPVAVATATPLGACLRGSEIEDDVPVVTTVILIPNEDDEEEIDLGDDENDEPQGILASLRPAPAPSLSSLRFWDRDSQAPKPKSGDGLQDGCPNPCWLLLWLLCTTFLVLAICSSYIIEDPFDDDFGPPFPTFLPFFLIPFIFFYILFLSMNMCGCADNTLNYLNNSKSSKDVEKQLKSSIADTNPTIHFHVHCYHKETEHYTDSDGNRRTRTTTVTTYSHSFPVRIASCTDQTDYSHLDLHKYKLTKVKALKSIVPDETFLSYQSKLHNENRHRDVFCDVTEQMELNGFVPHVLCIAEGQSKPCMMNSTVFIICHLLVVPALPYRIWMGHMTGKMRVEIRKAIQTDPTHLSESPV